VFANINQLPEMNDMHGVESDLSVKSRLNTVQNSFNISKFFWY